jgi:hypothetical protein
MREISAFGDESNNLSKCRIPEHFRHFEIGYLQGASDKISSQIWKKDGSTKAILLYRFILLLTLSNEVALLTPKCLIKSVHSTDR